MSAPACSLWTPSDRRTAVPYDSLIVAAGASQSYFGHPEFARGRARDEDDRPRARAPRGIFGAFEMAEHESDPVARRRWLTFVVVGAGPTGWSSPGSSQSCRADRCAANFRHIDPADARVSAAGRRRQPSSPRSPRRCGSARRSDLQRDRHRDPRGHHRHPRRRTRYRDQLGDPATASHRGGDEDLGRRRGGLAARPPARRETGAEVDRAGRVKVEPDLTIPGHPEIFVVGDLMSLDGLPGVAQVAIQSGRHAADTIARRVAGDTTRRPFRYRDLGTHGDDLSLPCTRRGRAGSRPPASAPGSSGWSCTSSGSRGSRTASPRCSTGRSPSSAAAAHSA